VEASGGADGLLLLHSLSAGRLLAAIPPPAGCGPAAAVCLAAGPCLVLVHTWGDLMLRVYDLNGRLLAAVDAGERLHVGGASAGWMAASPAACVHAC
jgi:hypothetical protein